MYLNHAHGLAILLESTFRVSAVALSLSTVKHGSFLFAWINEKTKKTKKNLKTACACLGLYTVYRTAVDQLVVTYLWYKYNYTDF